ncbi:MAG TPA: tetratricopeptide repeat protein [Rhizomicrobium sp.]|nr:tetratricopeptide repeat protein [Rhizomicrobium sp.]
MGVPGIGVSAALLGIVLVCAGTSAAVAQSFFNSWGRCADTKLPPERRADYCKQLVNNGGGPNSEILVLTLLGNLHRDMHRYPEAIDFFGRAVGYEALGVSDRREATNTPGSTVSLPTSGALVGALEGRAEVYAITGKRDLALADADHIFRLAPDAANSYAIRCRILAILKTEFDNALGDCSKALKLEPRNTQALGASGLLQYQLGHLKDAQDDFDQALGISPRLAGALYMRGVIELHGGDDTAGSADIAAATLQDPTIATSFADLGIKP